MCIRCKIDNYKLLKILCLCVTFYESITFLLKSEAYENLKKDKALMFYEISKCPTHLFISVINLGPNGWLWRSWHSIRASVMKKKLYYLFMNLFLGATTEHKLI